MQNLSEIQTDVTTDGQVESPRPEKFVPFVKERTSLGKLITLSATRGPNKPRAAGFKSERRLDSTLQEVAYLPDEGPAGLARQESARQMIAAGKYAG